MAKQVFISYSNEDHATAQELCRLLETQGFSCWIAPRDIPPGKDYGEAIMEGIEAAHAMVAILSASANVSTFVPREVERAVSKKKQVIPFRIQDVAPGKSLELFVSRAQWIDAWATSVEEEAKRLAASLRDLVGPGEPQPAGAHEATPRADLEWSLAKPAADLEIPLMDRFRYYVELAPRIQAALEGEFGWKGKALSLACLCINEIVDNAFEHGCKGAGEKEVRLCLEMRGEVLTTTVTDSGGGFDLAKVLAAAARKPPTEPRGRGLFFIKQIATDLVTADGGRTVRAVLEKSHVQACQAPDLKLRGKRPGPAAGAPVGAPSSSSFEPVPEDEIFTSPSLETLSSLPHETKSSAAAKLRFEWAPYGFRTMLFRLAGMMDAHSYESLEATLESVYEQGFYQIVFDLSRLDYISSAGVGVLMGADNRTQENAGRTVLINPTPCVLEVLTLLGLAQYMPIVEDLSAALASFPTPNRKEVEEKKLNLRLLRGAPGGTLFIGGLPPACFGSRSELWLTQFLDQPLAKSSGLVLEVPPGGSDSSLGVVMRLGESRGVPVRFLGRAVESYAAVFARGLEEAQAAISRYPQASVAVESDEGGLLVLRWTGDLVPATLQVLGSWLSESSVKTGGAVAGAVLVLLHREQGGVTHCDPQAVADLEAFLESRWPRRNSVLDFIRGEPPQDHAWNEWHGYLPEAFPCLGRLAVQDGTPELHLGGTVTSKDVSRSLAKDAQGRIRALRIAPGTFLTAQGFSALGDYLKKRAKAGHPALVVEGLPAHGKEAGQWFVKGWIEFAKV